jgi:hypothetical protein
VNSTGSGHGPVADCCKCGDDPSGSGATYLVVWLVGWLVSSLKRKFYNLYTFNAICKDNVELNCGLLLMFNTKTFVPVNSEWSQYDSLSYYNYEQYITVWRSGQVSQIHCLVSDSLWDTVRSDTY